MTATTPPSSIRHPLRPHELHPRRVYITPLGRCCRWLPAPRDNAASEGRLSFVYLARDKQTPLDDGFSLRDSNLRLLREAP